MQNMQNMQNMKKKHATRFNKFTAALLAFVLTIGLMPGGLLSPLTAKAAAPVAPTISTQPETLTEIATSADPVVLTVGVTAPSDGGTLSYQWYSNTENTTTGGTEIDDATSATYSIATPLEGAHYYYVVVTSTIDTADPKTATKTSEIAKVVLTKTAQTGFTFPNANATVTKTYGDAPFELAASGGNSTAAVTYEMTPTGVISLDASTSTATVLKAGTVTLKATSPEDATNSAATATVEIVVNKLALTPQNINDFPVQAYTGVALTPSVTFADSVKATPVANTDYTVTYKNNTAVGTATATITATANGNLTGTVSRTFIIQKAAGAAFGAVSGSYVQENDTYTYTVNPKFGAEYTINGGNPWQDSNVFKGIVPGTSKDIGARIKATANSNAGATSNEYVTFPKLAQIAPTIAYTKSTSGAETIIRVTSPVGANAMCSSDVGMTWMSIPNNLYFTTADGSAGIKVKLEATSTKEASPVSSLTIDFAKTDQAAPTVTFSTVEKTEDSKIELTVYATGGNAEGYEWAIDGATATTFVKGETATIASDTADLDPGKTYLIVMRSKPSNDQNASPNFYKTITMPKLKNTATLTMTATDNFTITDTSITMSTMPTSTATGDKEYSFDGSPYVALEAGTMQPFTGLTPATNHTISVRFAATTTTDASAATTLTIKTTGTATTPTAQTYALTVNAGTGGNATGGGNFAANSAVVISATTASGYEFNGWTSSNGGTFGDSWAEQTTFIMPANATTITANFKAKLYTSSVSSNSGKSDKITDVPAKTTSTTSNTATSIVSTTIPKVVTVYTTTQAINAANSAGTTGNVVTIAATQSEDVKLEKGVFQTIALKPEASLAVKAETMTVVFNPAAVANIASQTNTVSIIHAAPATTVTQAQANTINNRPVYEINVKADDKLISNFTGLATVTIPYTLKTNENANNTVVYYVNDSGAKAIVKNAVYSTYTQSITFATNHFSLYMIGNNDVTFNDVSTSHWGKGAIEFAAARELVKGVGNGNYSPDKATTRAEFVQMVQNVLNLPSATNATALSDVTSDAWYYKTIMSAQSAGLLKGLTNGGNFSPNQNITREEMAVILANVATYKQTKTPTKTVDLAKFKDNATINADYRDEIELAMKLGLVNENGMGNGNFDPQASTTRAQSAQVLRNLLQL